MKEIEELLQIFGAAGHPDLAAALERSPFIRRARSCME